MRVLSEYERRKFIVLVMIVSISGFSQGMLLPLISIIFEHDGVTSSMNGLHATGLYIGTLIISPFIEGPIRKFGYKPVILAGGFFVFVSLFMFPLWKSVVFWFVLRLIIGVGDSVIHFATQTWITSTTPNAKLGKSLAIYGLSFGVGFAVGPLLVKLISISEALPFIISSALSLIIWIFVFFLKNEQPIVVSNEVEHKGIQRYKVTLKYGWVAFLPAFVDGFLDSSLNTMFPIYAIRDGFDIGMVTIILMAFSIGGIFSEIPLGILGDKIGRYKILLMALGGGAIVFMMASFFEHSQILVAGAFFVAGLLSGSIFSLSVTYMTDLTPKDLLTTGNLLCGISLSLGSISGPLVGGMYLELFKGMSPLLLVAGFLIIVLTVLVHFGREKKAKAITVGSMNVGNVLHLETMKVSENVQN